MSPCPSCGTEVSPGAAFCTGCGAPVAGSGPPNLPPSPTPPFPAPPGAAPNQGPYPPPYPPGYQPPYPSPYPPGYQPPYQPGYPSPYPAGYHPPYQGGYPGQPAYPGYFQPVPPGPRTNGFAIASLVLGVVWIWWLGSILALVFGYLALGQIKKQGEAGRGIAIAGIVLGWVGVVTGVLFGVLIAVAAHHGSSS